MTKKKLYTIIGALIGLICIWIVFRETQWRKVFSSIHNANFYWLLISQIPLWMSFFLRIMRWRYIVRAVQPASFRSMFHATQIGLLANVALPARAGELVRAALLTRLTRCPLSRSIALVALDRITDLVALIAVLLLTMYFVHPTGDIVLPEGFPINTIPANIIRSFTIATAFTCVAVLVALVLLYARQRWSLRAADTLFRKVSKQLAEYVCRLLQHFAEGLHVFRSAGDMTKSILFSLLTWSCFIFAYECFMRGFDIAAPWYMGIVMTGAIAVLISVPGPPGFIGQYELGVVGSFMMVDSNSSISQIQAMSLVSHLFIMLPTVIAGAYCLFTEHVALRSITEQAEDKTSTEPS